MGRAARVTWAGISIFSGYVTDYELNVVSLKVVRFMPTIFIGIKYRCLYVIRLSTFMIRVYMEAQCIATHKFNHSFIRLRRLSPSKVDSEDDYR